MRWTIPPRPKSADHRVRRGFAFFPTRMSDGSTKVWLEFYWAFQTYHCGYELSGWYTTQRHQTVKDPK